MKRQGKKINSDVEKPTKKTLVQTKLVPDQSNFFHEPEKTQFFGETIRISHWNVNSLAACEAKDDFKNYFKNNDFDIICFNETKLSYERFKKLQFASNIIWFNRYFQYWNFSTRKLGYSGVAVFTKEKPLSVEYDINAKDFEKEGRVITLEFPLFYLVYVYAPNSGLSPQRLVERADIWEISIREHMEKLKQKKGVILLGDMNVAPTKMDLTNPEVNIHSPGFTEEERNRFAELISLGYKDCYRELYPDVVKYTWWSQRAKTARINNIGWRIDHCIVDEKTFPKIKDVIIRNDVFGSDHCPVEVQIDLSEK